MKAAGEHECCFFVLFPCAEAKAPVLERDKALLFCFAFFSELPARGFVSMQGHIGAIS